MRHFFTVTISCLAMAALGVPAALAGDEITAHVRVEGKSRTIFGSTAPLLTPFQGVIHAEDGTPVELPQPTALGLLEAASVRGEFFYNVQQFSFGSFVNQVGRYAGKGLRGWSFKVNGRAPDVGASAVVLEDGDSVLWYWTRLDPTTFAGPPTLDIVWDGRCLIAYEVDAAGTSTQAQDVKFKLDERRRIFSRKGRVCTASWRTAQVVKRGAIRSQTLIAS